MAEIVSQRGLPTGTYYKMVDAIARAYFQSVALESFVCSSDEWHVRLVRSSLKRRNRTNYRKGIRGLTCDNNMLGNAIESDVRAYGWRDARRAQSREEWMDF